MGVLRLGGDGPEDLEVQLVEGQSLIDTIKLVAGPGRGDGVPEGNAVDWPAGTQAWLIVKGRNVAVRSDLDVSGPYLYLDMDAADVGKVPREAKARLWIHYPDGDPFVFARGGVLW